MVFSPQRRSMRSIGEEAAADTAMRALVDISEEEARAVCERDDEIDCQRIVQDDGGRTLPLYYDDYN